MVGKTPCTVAHHAFFLQGIFLTQGKSMGFSRQEYWLPFPPPGDVPYPGIEPVSFRSPTLAGGVFTTNATWEAQVRDRSSLVYGTRLMVWDEYQGNMRV